MFKIYYNEERKAISEKNPYHLGHPGHALIDSKWDRYVFKFEEKMVIVYNIVNPLSMYYLYFREKDLMEDFYNEFKEKLNMTEADFKLLLEVGE